MSAPQILDEEDVRCGGKLWADLKMCDSVTAKRRTEP